MSDPMQLTEKDWEMLAEALQDYEDMPIIQSSLSITARAIVGIGMGREPEKGEIKEVTEKGRRESEGRKRVTIVLKAKVELARQSAQAEAIAVAAGGIKS